MNKKKDKVRVGVTIGDLNGIGLEVIIKTFMDSRMSEICTPVVYGSSRAVSYHRKALNITDFSFNIINDIDAVNPKLPNLLNLWPEEINIELGKSSSESGTYAFKSLEAATQDLAGNKIDVLVTAPINKKSIQSSKFDFPGHTEYLAAYANEENPLMMMVSPKLKLGVVTGHIPLKEVASAVTTESILKKLDVFNKSLIQDFRINKPKIAVLGLNPHAGDEGLLGDEESNVILPAIKQARENGILAIGPFGADGFFGSSIFTQFDGVLAMYHDQGLGPFKALSFDDGVNFTAGLPIVRTSPDHGVGLDIAGKGIASELSFRNSVYLACDIYNTRKEFRSLTENPLPTSKS